MKKTFKQLTVGDSFFEITEGRMEYEKKTVVKVEGDTISYAYSNSIKRVDSHKMKLDRDYYNNNARYLVTTEADAIRYCKSQMMKALYGLISDARKKIINVVEFKKKHYQLLQHDWTEKQINLLESEVNQL